MTVSNSTDTNQASEDELRDLVIRVMRYANLLSPRKLNEPVDPMVNYAIGGTVADIKAIIRTEKLKLLAEVRERAEMVVGNVFDPSGEYVSVSEIDKLEAEL